MCALFMYKQQWLKSGSHVDLWPWYLDQIYNVSLFYVYFTADLINSGEKVTNQCQAAHSYDYCVGLCRLLSLGLFTFVVFHPLYGL